MAKKKVLAQCVECATVDGMYIDVGEGRKLPSYSIVFGKGLFCPPCAKKVGV